VAASWSFTENCHACTAIMLGAYGLNARSTPQQPGHAAGLPDDRRSTEESRGSQAWWTARTRSLAREVHSLLYLFANAAIVASRLACSSIFRFEFLIRRSQLQILLLHNGRELVEIF
jgi:hypothetical protein